MLSIFWYTENIWDSFQEEGQLISYGSDPKDMDILSGSSYNQIQVDLTTTFTILIGIFFPSVTGKLRIIIIIIIIIYCIIIVISLLYNNNNYYYIQGGKN